MSYITKIKIYYTCCNGCKKQHATKIGALLHWCSMWVRWKVTGK